MKTQTHIIDAARKALQAYAWPGGYPVMYLAREGWREEDGKLTVNQHDRSENVCCAKCAADVDKWPDIIITADYVHYEGEPEQCEYCNSLTDSAMAIRMRPKSRRTKTPSGVGVTTMRADIYWVALNWETEALVIMTAWGARLVKRTRYRS